MRKRKCRVRDTLITLLLNFIGTPESGTDASLVPSGVAFSSAVPISSPRGCGAALLEQDDPGVTAIHDESTPIVKSFLVIPIFHAVATHKEGHLVESQHP